MSPESVCARINAFIRSTPVEVSIDVNGETYRVCIVAPIDERSIAVEARDPAGRIHFFLKSWRQQFTLSLPVPEVREDG